MQKSQTFCPIDLPRQLPLQLQLFAQGAGSGGGDTGADGATGVASGDPGRSGGKDTAQQQKDTAQHPTEAGQTGQHAQDAAAQQVEDTDRAAEFERMIKGDYRELYNARVQETVQRRLRGTRETVDKYNALTPALEMLANRYGVDAADIEALNKAIAEDDSFYEQEASERGLSVQELKNIRRMERENARLKKQMREQTAKQNADRLYANWMQQSDRLKTVYPGFDLQAELANEGFVNLLKNNVDLRTAYEVLHRDEIIPAAMQYTAQTVQRKTVNSILANGSRPTENGMSGASTAVVRSDVSQLTKAERQEYARRAARGERITFQ